MSINLAIDLYSAVPIVACYAIIRTNQLGGIVITVDSKDSAGPIRYTVHAVIGPENTAIELIRKADIK